MERLGRYHRAVTTEKDAVKLARYEWPRGTLLVLGLRPNLFRGPEFWTALESRLQQAGKPIRKGTVLFP